MRPSPLKPGDTVALVSPASPLAAEKLVFVTDLLERARYSVKTLEHVLEADGYLAGTDADRAHDLMTAFADPQVSAVLCTRGGYGCARLFPYLNLDTLAKSGKLFAGFSDVTTLHIALNRRGLPTLHAPMALTLHYPRADWVTDSFLRALQGDFSQPSEAPKPTTVVPGVAEGQTVGGCLCLICDTIGTPEEIDTEGKILLIEDVDEHPHRIDAMLTHLLNSGLAAKASGFVIAEMTRTDERVDEAIGGKPWREIVVERLAPLGKPMVMEMPFGHVPNMMSLPLGLTARFDADAGTLTYLERW
jgi:muramoyltetrapeptide carboxypeptidase